jgi:hypothetical protein
MNQFKQKLNEIHKEAIKEQFRTYIVRPRCSYCGWRPADWFRFPITQDEVAIPLYACQTCMATLQLGRLPIIWEKLKLKNDKPR